MKYCLPYFEYESDEDGEVEIGIACPQCGDPSDYCLDHNHWYCEDCGEYLHIDDNLDDPIWICEACDGKELEPVALSPIPGDTNDNLGKPQ